MTMISGSNLRRQRQAGALAVLFLLLACTSDEPRSVATRAAPPPARDLQPAHSTDLRRALPTAPINPRNFTATAEIGGEVTLHWDAVPGVAFYRVAGPGIPGNVAQLPASVTNLRVRLARDLTAGTYEYSIVAYPNGSTATLVNTADPARARVTLRGLPPHPQWLTWKDRYAGQQNSFGPASEIEATAYASATLQGDKGTLAKWKTANGFDSSTGVIRAVYYNAGDLNLGRDMQCKQAGQTVACFVANHGPFPGQPDFPDVERALDGAISGRELIGTVAMEVSLAKPDEVKFYSFNQLGIWSTFAFLDNESGRSRNPYVGAYSPFNCIACHGGTYDYQAHTVHGASFLPFDVFSFKYSEQPPYTQAAQEDAFRQLNLLVRSTRPNGADPNSAIVTFIDGMYGGRVNVPGTRANDSWVPPGWSSAPNVYNAIVKPFCRTCHLAMSGDLSLATYQKFRLPAVNPNTGQYLGGLKERIQSAICNGSMPHAEVPFRKFWQNPYVYWRGYLEDPSVLGMKCSGA